jgi:pimeloyl-ACP methyl ester carboxylesterase
MAALAVWTWIAGGGSPRRPLKRRLVPTLVLMLTMTACGGTNLRGHDVQLTEVPYVFRGQRLALQIGTPSVPVAADLPLALFIEGDGGQCQDYRPGLWRRFLLRFTGNFELVRPRGFVNVTCDTAAWRTLDFHARISELAVEVAVLKARFPGRKLYLVGHSAGAHVAILYTLVHANDVAGIVNLGGGLQELSVVLRDIAAERARSGRGTDPEKATAEVSQLVSDVEARGPNDTSLFWNRTYQFWYQTGSSAAWSADSRQANVTPSLCARLAA